VDIGCRSTGGGKKEGGGTFWGSGDKLVGWKREKALKIYMEDVDSAPNRKPMKAHGGLGGEDVRETMLTLGRGGEGGDQNQLPSIKTEVTNAENALANH